MPQSAGEAQASPGEVSRQVPKEGKQAAHPCLAAVGAQQKPPAQAEEVQDALEAQGAPGGRVQEVEPGAEELPAGHSSTELPLQ